MRLSNPWSKGRFCSNALKCSKTAVSAKTNYFSYYSNLYFALFRDEAIPDPIKLIRRISALEAALQKMEADCSLVAEMKEMIILDVTSLQAKNAKRLEKVRTQMASFISESNISHMEPLQLSTTLGKKENGENDVVPNVHRQWKSMTTAVEEQHDLYVNRNQSSTVLDYSVTSSSTMTRRDML